ncbi:hypothetical protein C8A03DRAFT_29385 [Achaetomium macrosporum]|uniref:Mediator complex subunit 15 KIX domain-containing protein n=1 Tax=Achaetomium macrosporum TaxID=79813 RepID=A0AAN7CJZ8_9PEZI|nr:hypothetical protein C8A03DRAFT_29385 [Achaetomium macrosporum]
MAANIPQMAPNGQMMMLQQQQQHPQPPQQSNKQLNQLVYSSLMQTMHLAPMNSWQSSVSIQDRFAKTVNLYESISSLPVSNTILAYPQNQSEWQKLCHSALEFEKKAFVHSVDKQSYDHAMQQRIQDLVKRRQNLVPDLQNQLSTDAARQAQLQAAQQRQQQQQQQQMMISQMAAARGLGQPPPHGFQSLQGPMQVPAMAQQPQQMGMGIAPPGMLQNRPEQHQFPMQMGQTRQPAFVPPGSGQLNQLSAQDKARVNELALQSMNRTPEEVKANIRNLMRSKLSPAQLAEAAANGRDLAMIWFHNYAINELQKKAQQRSMMQQQRPGVPANLMAQAPHHGGQMNPALMNTLAPQTVMPDGQMFVPNMESIRNDQAMGFLAEQAGQVVVPASTAPGRNAAPGVIAGLPPQPMPGNQQGPSQTPRPPQAQQPFGMPPVKMDAAAAQAQAQSGVRPVAGRPMQGQPPGMAAPSALPKTSPSPALVGTTLNPQFNHQNNTRPPSLPGNMNNPAMAGMPPNLTPEVRAGMSAPPANGTTRELINEWREQQRAASNGFPGAKQGLAAGQGAMPPGARPPAMPQQPAGEGDGIMGIIQTPQGRASMNSMDVPPVLLDRLRQVVGIVPAEIRKWGQLRQFLANNPNINTPQMSSYLNNCQIAQFKQLWERKIGATAPNAPVLQQPANSPMALPPGAQYPPNIAQITPGDIQNVRQRNPTLQAMPDDAVIEIARRLKRDSFARKAWEVYNLRQSSQAQVPGVQKPAVPVSQTPITQQTMATSATHPNPLPQAAQHQAAQPKPAGAPVAEVATAPASGALKNGRAPPNPSPATAPKNLKRPNPDDAGDVPGQPANAAQRAPQPDQRPPPTGASKPNAEQLMKMAQGRPGPSANPHEAAAVMRLRLLHGEVAQLAQQEEKQEVVIQMSPTEVQETRLKIAKATEKINQFRGANLPLWYHLTKDDSRAKMFFKTQRKVLRQFTDQKTMRQFRPGLTISKDELDQFINMMDSMLRDLEALKKGSQDAPAVEPQIPQIDRPVPDLVLPPARKKPKTGTSQASPPTAQQQGAASSSPQVKAPSPVVTRKAEPPKQLPPKLTCPEPGCEMGSMGFPSDEALNAHRQEEHVKPFENPYGFLQEQMAAALGLDAQGNPKASPNPSGQEGSTPAAPPMSATRSKQGQTPKMGATPMSRAVSMQRQGSTAGGKAAENGATPSGGNTAFKGGQATSRPPAGKNEMGTPHAPVVEDAWSSSTVDPQNLFQSVARSLESVTGSFVPEFGTYRSLTPNDTPESSKDSGASEPSSDIPEGTSLDIDVAWQSALDSDLLWDMNNINMETFEDVNAGMFANEEYESLMFSLDNLDNDLSKPLHAGQVPVFGGRAQ